MNKSFFILLFIALAAYGQQTSVAVLPSEGAVLSGDEIKALTDEMRIAALKVLPTKDFVLLKQDVVVKRLGGAESYIKKCKESSCIVDLGKKAQVDYVAQASVSKLGSKIRLTVELYNVRTEGLVGMFSDDANNVRGLLDIVKKKAPEVFSKIKSYLVNITSDPEGADLSFDGGSYSSCTTPCKVELPEGKVRITANLEQYEAADTTVSVKQNNQKINIKLKPNFGILEVKPAYLDGIGKDEEWSLTLNGQSFYSLENQLPSGKYKGELSHRCYEDVSFNIGVGNGKRQVFDMAKQVKLKKNGSVPLCAEIDKGSFTDSRDGKRYRVVKIGNQVWMAENLNYNASGSKCNDNNLAYCQKYGRLYDWNTAMRACPKSWHLPSDAEWTRLTDFVGGSVAGAKLKAASGWNSNGNGTDEFGFSALPGGYGNSVGRFRPVGDGGVWWSATESRASIAWSQCMYMYYGFALVVRDSSTKSDLYSVRCVHD